MGFVFVFPGQGSQAVGMGASLADAFPAARKVFDRVDAALEQDLSALMREGPMETLTLTENAQPALMAASLAVIRVLEDEFELCVDSARYVAGHSLGEYSALAAAGALSLEDAARLLKRRWLAMQAAVPVGEGAMAALLGASGEDAAEAIAQGADAGDIAIANDNAPGQIVISGHKAAVEKAIAAAKALGVKKAVLLPVSAPFHCALMAPAAVEMHEALSNVDILEPKVPLVTNVSARVVTDPETIRTHLVDQVTGTVRWRESVNHMVEAGVDLFVECGAGKVLTQMLKRTAPDAKGLALNTPEDLEAFVKAAREGAYGNV
ncbi:MAG: ACP S-malonyltransferase [Maricaulaceae bacterium]